MTRTSGRTLTLVIGTGPHDGATIAALRLAEQAVARGHRVAVFTHGDGATVGADGASTGPAVEALLRQGVHGGLVSWVVDGEAFGRSAAGRAVAGVVEGSGGDLWRFVLDGDVTLGVAP